MKTDIREICSDVVKKAIQSGADDCKVTVNSTRFVEINYREHRPESIKEATSRRLSLDVYVDGKYSAQSTPDLRDQALNDFIIQSIENTRFLAEDPYRSLPDEKYYGQNPEKDFKLVDPNYESITPDQRHELARTIENACLEKGGDKVISVEAGTYDQLNEQLIMNSKGFEGKITTTDCWAGAQMTARDEGDRRPNGYHWVGSRYRKDLPNPESIGKEAAQRTLALLGGKKIPTETLPVIIENRNAGRILSGFISAMNGWSLDQKRSFLIDKKASRVGSNLFTLIDDPLIIGGFGTRFYDGDGIKALKRTMVKEGILKEYYIDWYYSRKLKVEPTTGGTSNLVLPAGKRPVSDIMKDLGRGILITGFIGGNSNSTTGDASIGILGHLFEDGEPTQAIAEMNIADNHLKFWNKLVEVANDPWPYGSWNLPSLVFDDIVVSGV